MRLINILNNKISLYRVFRLRRRYVLTKGNWPRLRYLASSAVVMSMMFASLMGATSSSVAFAPINNDIISTVAITTNDKYDIDMLQPLPLNIIEEAAEIVVKDLSPYEEIIKISSGGTIAGALQDAGVSGAEAYRVVKVMSEHYDPRSIRPGQVISIYVDPSENDLKLTGLDMKITPIKELIITRDELERFSAKVNEAEVTLQTKAAMVSIETSLYGSAAKSGVPASIVAEMIKIYSYDVDFQRDIRRGDKVEILYETYETRDGMFVRYGNILYASLKVGGREIPVYRYGGKDGYVDYYRENGASLKRALMRTPVDGARMSSGYGMRRHPVLGYNKMHKGVDFAAPRGTPIYAAGNGVIEKAGRNGGYGNYIRIRHNNGLKTAYAHMRKFAKGMKSGKRVSQGDVIGYVGTTGRSTGPHLHFEVIKNGKQINPKSVRSSSGEKLAGRKLKDFQARILAVKQKYVVLAQDLKFAKNEL